MKIPCTCRHIVILLLAFGLSAPRGNSQPEPAWDMDSIRTSVITLLQRYEFLHNRLSSNADSDMEKAFIQLFSNPRIQVVSDFNGDSVAGRISIQDYVANLMEYYPGGVRVELVTESAYLGKPRFDRNDRYIVRARIDQTKTVLKHGKEYNYRSRRIFLVAFNYTERKNSDFVIFGIEPAPVTCSRIGLEFSPSRTSFTNSVIDQDSRFDLKSDWSYRIGLTLSHFFNSHWGISVRPGFRTLSGSLTLDSFDAFGGFDPNLKNIVFSNRIWMAGCPVFLTFRMPLGIKWSSYIGAGLSPEIRIFETQLVTGENENTGLLLDNVISEPDWVEKMNRFNLGFEANAGLAYKVSRLIELTAGAAYFQGLTSLDHNVQASYEDGKYTGRFNPLWGNNAKTLYRDLSISVGFMIILSKEKR
ncbi:MAG: hypothetical protein V2A67_11510 [Bacteroidota bacterium]